MWRVVLLRCGLGCVSVSVVVCVCEYSRFLVRGSGVTVSMFGYCNVSLVDGQRWGVGGREGVAVLILGGPLGKREQRES